MNRDLVALFLAVDVPCQARGSMLRPGGEGPLTVGADHLPYVRIIVASDRHDFPFFRADCRFARACPGVLWCYCLM